ncbi:MAG: FixH family protein [Myxococcota bacterium]|nr:FixH family protein [Myxococcota bacterium]MEC8422202.1 FixH family protein [Myxococcota bacterium]
MRINRSAILAILALGCGAGRDSGVAPVPDVRRVQTDGGTWTVSYVPDPDPIPGNQEFALDITVADDAGPASGTTIVLTADMPDHGHGMNQTPALTGSDGAFRAEGMLFHMTGRWRLLVDVTGDAGIETAEMWISCCE